MIRNVWNQRVKETGSVRAANGSRPWYRYAKELLSEKVIPSDADRAVLDVGCGVGEFMLTLRELGFTVEGVDGNQEQMDIVHSMGFKGRVADLEDGLPYPDESFGLVTCLELIEHIALAEDLLKEIHRVLHPGGYLLLTTTNFAFYNNRVHYLLGTGPLHEGYHLRHFTRNHLLRLLESIGIRMIASNSYGPIPFLSELMSHCLQQEPFLWHVAGQLESLFASDFVYLTRKA